ncbi:MAG: HD domain-containing protein [Clostridia bacterium]|jgi:nicotinate-nucleotide adenylyltransferase|nr:HD domain-containing protein [Clostridia bacterium]
MNIEEIKENLSKRLSEKRYTHSLGTMNAAKELASIYGENVEEAEIAGLIHDVAKELRKDEIEEYLERYNIKPDEIEQIQIGLLHAKLGAVIARDEFNLSREIQKAIEYHTTGNKNMDNFAKIIYLADKIEENRNYDNVEEFRILAKQSLDEAMLAFLDFTIQKTIKKGHLIHPDTVDLRNFLLNHLTNV